MTELTYTNPRMFFETADWPYGKQRTTAKFTIETGSKGQRAVRVTQNPKSGAWNKPKKTTFAMRARIVDGSDGKTYIAEYSKYGFFTVMQSNLQYQEEVIHPDNDKFQAIADLFT